jgi:hypothetical protein
MKLLGEVEPLDSFPGAHRQHVLMALLPGGIGNLGHDAFQSVAGLAETIIKATGFMQ